MKSRKEAGFTMIEVIVAIAIISIALVPTASMRLKAAQANAAIEEREKYAILVQRLLETKVRAVPFDQLVSSNAVDMDTGFTYAITVTASSPTLRKVTITATAPGSATPIDRLVTLVAKEANH